MLSGLTNYFIPKDKQDQGELSRRYRLVVNIILITILFDLNYAGITVLINLSEGTIIMLWTALLNIFLLFLIKKRLPLLLATNLYIFFGVLAIVVCIYFSGGFASPVLPWLATSPIVALLMGGRNTGLTWMIINCCIMVVFGVLNNHNYDFPSDYDHSWDGMFYLNCYVGLVLIIFAVAYVFESGKNTAFKQLAEKNILLAEEKKKQALQKISQEIHDNIGQTLSLAKLNLHSIHKLDAERSKAKVEDTLQLVAKAIQDLRELSNNLHSDNITDFNLTEAIRNELDMLSRIGHYGTELEVSGSYYKLTPQTELIIYRIYQEIINNIIKHSGAKSIIIKIWYELDQFSLVVEDNGRGFNCEEFLSKGQGLSNIQSRTKLLGGQVEIDSVVNKGTTIGIVLPLEESLLA